MPQSHAVVAAARIAPAADRRGQDRAQGGGQGQGRGRYGRLSAVLVGLLLVLLPGWAAAQDSQRLSPTLQALLRPENPVVGRVGTTQIHWNDVIYSARNLPEEQQKQVVPLFNILLARLVDRQLLADQARAQGYAGRKDIKEAVRRFEEDLMREAYVADYIAKNVSSAAVEQRVQALSNGKPGEDAARRQQVRAEMSRLALDRLLTQLRQKANITLYPPR